MEEILTKFQSQSTFNDQEKSEFEGLYKYWGKYGNQEQRRKELLEIQRNNRYAKIDRIRGIMDNAEIEQNDMEIEVDQKRDLFQRGKHTRYRPTIYVAGFNKVSPTYRDVLMMSEWFIEKPADFAENWLMVPCPKGLRMLVVANRGKTKFYSKQGHFIFEKNTALPGGNPSEWKHKWNFCTILDCFYSKTNNTMYIVDLIAWCHQPMTDGETDFRHFWLQSKTDEMPELKRITKNNNVMFELLPKVPCDLESLNKFMMKHPMFENASPELDGLLLYHRRAHYVSAETPLVGWLYPYMVPEVIGPDVTVNPLYLLEKPEDYVNQEEFIKQFTIKANLKKSKRSSQQSKVPHKGKCGWSDKTESMKMEAESKVDEDTSVARSEEAGTVGRMDEQGDLHHDDGTLGPVKNT